MTTFLLTRQIIWCVQHTYIHIYIYTGRRTVTKIDSGRVRSTLNYYSLKHDGIIRAPFVVVGGSGGSSGGFVVVVVVVVVVGGGGGGGGCVVVVGVVGGGGVIVVMQPKDPRGCVDTVLRGTFGRRLGCSPRRTNDGAASAATYVVDDV